jgi:TolB-like protein/DNA-binding winged helix-turn-helix (wHTH) protein/Flp pilus assembly protein TadD
MKSFQSFRLDPTNHCLWNGEERVRIPPKAFDVLRYLVENPERLVTQDELLQALWPDTYVNPEVLRKYILDIRKILGDRPDKPTFIETLPKRGYRFVATVDDRPADPSPLPASAALEEAVLPDSPASRQATLLDKGQRRTWPILGASSVMIIIIAIIAVIATHFWSGRNKRSAHAPNNTSVAVLPFADMSPDKDQEYFSEGLTEELINNLTKISGLKVAARSSAFQFKGQNEDLRNVGRQLGVANVLEGSVRKEGNRLRITADLTNVDDGFQLWAETYNIEVNNVFAAQDKIAAAVSRALQVKLLSPDGAALSVASRSTNPNAYQAYLQGQYFAARGQDKDDLKKALSYANQATELDPNYAPAWAQRAQALQGLARIALIEPDEGFRAARESAEKAIALDPNLATGYLTLGLVRISYDWNWEGADASLSKAAQLEPGSAAVLGSRAYLARHLGRLEETIALYRQAIALDPLRANAHLSFGYVLYLVGQYDEAKAELQKAQELNSRLSGLHFTRGQIFLAEGHPQEALTEIEQETGDWDKLSGEALAYAALGNRRESDEALKKLIATHQDDAAYQIAEAYAFRGETEKAFQWMDRAIRQRDAGAPELQINPLMKSLRQDPRYAGLLKKMHLPA